MGALGRVRDVKVEEAAWKGETGAEDLKTWTRAGVPSKPAVLPLPTKFCPEGLVGPTQEAGFDAAGLGFE